MRTVIVGPGRLGRTLARWLTERGADVVLVGRGPVPAGDVVWLTVPDRAVAEVAARVPPGPVVLHAAGALDLDVLGSHAARGSVHPLMTFPGPEVAMPDPDRLPAAIAGTPEALGAARRLCATLGFRPFEVRGDRRLYHAAAVVAGNLSTVLVTEAAALLEAAGVPPADAREVLVPLAVASVRNSALGLRAALTGPLARGDRVTVSGHLDALRDTAPELSAAYADLVALVEERLGTRDLRSGDKG